MTQWGLTNGSDWSKSVTTASSFDEALQTNRELLTLRMDETTDYQTPAADVLLEHLVLDAPEGEPGDVEWPFDMNNYLEEDYDFPEREGLVQRFSRVNGQRVQFAARVDGEYVGFFSSSDEPLGTLLADYSWGSEAGMTSGAGSWVLTRTFPSTLITIPAGDTADQPICGFKSAADMTSTARIVREWLTYIEYSCMYVFGAAALALEPLDPLDKLSQAERKDWQNYLDRLRDGYNETIRMSFSIDLDLKAALRKELRSSSTYRTIADALADPIQGDWLRVAFSDGNLEPLW
ncbi:hypothetical protein [Allobranchiibius sp. GilTou73]|uniref:hypothetical protein n=1 Tax=Allobranchiibius sp. GilTou73 TaxID=2904523 RepID=UPI001F42F8DD|nr:hypothetical protein [Allobranchiibius sp. GilTou73]UIJ35073.1 hypothetical protein LVQ62_01270 [Allobranchiibius sp. GilTou73]